MSHLKGTGDYLNIILYLQNQTSYPTSMQKIQKKMFRRL